MITRRSIVTGGVLAGAFGTEAGLPQRTAAGSDDALVRAVQEVRDELKSLRGTPCNSSDCADVERIRAEQRTFLKGHGKFPEFVDVGADVWDRVSDWHIRNRVPLQVMRLPDGRYGVPFYQTVVVLRPDVGYTYIGQGYDK